MTQPIISVRDISKVYRLGEIGMTSLREEAAKGIANLKQKFSSQSKEQRTKNEERAETEFWALRDVSFDVMPGEVVGIIGKNGAGKSTLLKVISRITEPSHGEIRLRGRVAALLEVGTGFHPELTGRENIYLNGTILGMKKREIDRKLDEIIDFSGIEKHIDTPVKRYSSGMNVRLGFAVAANLEPEILIIDEVLAVGDADFRDKCANKMAAVAGQGRTILFVSHNLTLVSKLCNRSILLSKGKKVIDSDTSETIGVYHSASSADRLIDIAQRTDRHGNGLTRIIGLTVNDSTDSVVRVSAGSKVSIKLQTSKPLAGSYCRLSIYDMFDGMIAHFRSDTINPNGSPSSNTSTYILEVKHLLLVSGDYKINVAIMYGSDICDRITDAIRIEVLEGEYNGIPISRLDPEAHIYIDHNWKH